MLATHNTGHAYEYAGAGHNNYFTSSSCRRPHATSTTTMLWLEKCEALILNPLGDLQTHAGG